MPEEKADNKAVVPRKLSANEEIYIRALFDELDLNKSGEIDSDELKSGIKRANIDVSEEQVARMIKIADKDGNQVIDFEEFKEYVRNLPERETLTVDKLLSKYWVLEAEFDSDSVPAPTANDGKSTWKYLVAGGVAGSVSRTATSPLERMKILYQLQGYPPKYTSVMGTVKTILKEEGFLAFWKGNGTNVLRIAPYTAIQFFAYERYTKLLLAEGAEDLSIPRRLCAGALAGITSSFFTYPLDLVRTRLTAQTNAGKYKGMVHGIKHVVKEEGLFALYKGTVITLMGIAPYVGINFTVYDSLKKKALNFYRTDNLSTPTIPVPVSLTCGALSGAAALTATYPIDLVRRRFQMGDQFKYRNVLDAFTSIVRSEGYRGLFQGLSACYLKVMPAMAVNFVTYEFMKKAFKVQ
eukprot:Nk52_evm86s1444 gene=Nk52_evmTU86s1444